MTRSCLTYRFTCCIGLLRGGMEWYTSYGPSSFVPHRRDYTHEDAEAVSEHVNGVLGRAREPLVDLSTLLREPWGDSGTPHAAGRDRSEEIAYTRGGPV